MKKLFLLFAATLLVSGCGEAGKPRGYISKEMFGDKWPLTVPDGVVSCEDGHFVLLNVNGTIYAVNGSARDAITYQGKSWTDFEKSGLWLRDPKDAGLKVNISPVLDTGLDLCKEQ